MCTLENSQTTYRLNPSMGRTRTDGPDEFEPSKFDCMSKSLNTDLSLCHFMIIMVKVLKKLNDTALPYAMHSKPQNSIFRDQASPQI